MTNAAYEATNSSEVDSPLSEALDFDLFEGDFGEPGDSELSNKIVTGRGEYTCHICAGQIIKGEIHRSATYKFSGELMSYRCCNACCVAMVGSVTNAYITEDDDSEIDDPIEARYALGYERREASNG